MLNTFNYLHTIRVYEFVSKLNINWIH